MDKIEQNNLRKNLATNLQYLVCTQKRFYYVV